MESTPARKPRFQGPFKGPFKSKDQSGIALFMVLAAISVLAIMVTEFTYIAQMNEKLAFDGVDQVKAHYLAKTGLKLSLLRLKAYAIVKDFVGGANKNTGGAAPQVPKDLIDKIWSFPFIYPIPTSIPGLTGSDKDQIDKFQKGSSLDGSFTATIESASSRYNVNSILPSYGIQPSPTPSSAPSSTPSSTPSSSPSSTPYNADEARKSLSDYLQNLFTDKTQNDDDFATDERDFRIDDFMDGVVGWSDPAYERRTSGMNDPYPMKKAPFYSLTEMHMLPGMDDELYGLFAPALTVNQTPGININTMQAPTLKALVPNMTVDEVNDFFKFRDDPEQDNTFKSPDDFFKYLQNSVAAYKNEAAIGKLKDTLAKQNIKLIVDENEFKITVVATVNNSTRKLEAWVTLYPPKNTPTTTGGGTPPPATPAGQNPQNGTPQGQQQPADPGLRITFMRMQ